MMTSAQSVVAFISNKVKLDASMELAPALRMQLHTLLDEFSTRMKRQGRWATARYMHKRGFPIELALMAIYY